MHPKLATFLQQHRMKHLIECAMKSRAISSFMGFTVDFSGDWILMHQIECNTYRMNGYVLFREHDVKKWREFASPESWHFRAAKMKKMKPIRPRGLSVCTLHDCLRHLKSNHQMAIFHLRNKPSVCYVGVVEKISRTSVTYTDLDSDCEWTGRRTISLRTIEYIEWGDGYSQALAMTSPKRKRRTSS